MRMLPPTPFKVLDAPGLRDDFYCSILAFSPDLKIIAVGLGRSIYSWSEKTGARELEQGPQDTFITSIDFSTQEGGNSILAYGRSDGSLSLMSLRDVPILVQKPWPRFVLRPSPKPTAIAAVAWKPTLTTFKSSAASLHPPTTGVTEDLLVGDEDGSVYYYSVQWPGPDEVERSGWPGRVSLLLQMSVHAQQVCGLSWSASGARFSTGGNDNLCTIFETDQVIPESLRAQRHAWLDELYWNTAKRPKPRGTTISGGDPAYSWSQPTLSGLWPFGTMGSQAVRPTEYQQYRDFSNGGTSSWAQAALQWQNWSLPDDRTDSDHWMIEAGSNTSWARSYDFPPANFAQHRLVAQKNTMLDDLGIVMPTMGSWSGSRSTPQILSAASVLPTFGNEPLSLSRTHAKHHWILNAAVKAIAFCPWREGLVAVGGGSCDKCIHFFHTTSGAPLASIAVHAQVTSLVWSTTRREIAATFGYAVPDHRYRIAVFNWPQCQQVAAIPWERDSRALYAIPFPRSVLSETNSDGTKKHKDDTRGCLVVASSDESVKFFEIWTTEKKATVGSTGLLGGCRILEDMEGIEQELDVIR